MVPFSPVREVRAEIPAAGSDCVRICGGTDGWLGYEEVLTPAM